MKSWQLGRYAQILRIASFRRFWLGFTASFLGDTMTRVALTWLVYETTDSPEALGLLALFFTGPVVVGGLVAGWLLDRFDRPKVILFDSIVRGVAVGSVPVLHVLGALELAHIYAVAAVYGSLMMIPLAGGPALVPDLVPGSSLDTANALEVLSFTLGGVIGPPLAGLIIARFGAPTVLYLDAATYFGFAAAVAGIRIGAGRRAAGAGLSRRYRISDAFTLVRRSRVLLSTTLMFMAFNVGFGAALVWLPVYADRVLGGGPGLYGVLLGLTAVGEVLSSLLVGGLRMPFSLGIMIASSQLLAGSTLALLLLSNNHWWVFVVFVLFGLLHSPLTIWAQTLRMQIIPAELRGRTFALLRTMMQGASPLGGLLSGYLLPVIGMSALIEASSGMIAIPGLVGLQVRELRQADDRRGGPDYSAEPA